MESIVVTPPRKSLNFGQCVAQSTPAVVSKSCFPSGNLTEIVSPHEADADCLSLNDQEESFVQDIITQEDPSEELPFECVSREAVAELGSDDERVDSGSYSICKYGGLSDEKQVISEAKCIASVSQLKVLLGIHCRHSGCSSYIKSVLHKVIGFCVKLEWFCDKAHRGVWYSSPFYASGLAINYVMHSSLLLSGRQFNKFKRFCKFANVGNCSGTTFYENQRLYASTAVDQEFKELRQDIIDEVKAQGKGVVLCGDGRMDSPGFSATKGTYTVMEHSTKKLLNMECGDKREVRSTKPNRNIILKYGKAKY